VPADRRAVQGAETVEVTIPARAEFVSVARLTAAAVAARRGFTYDEIEDLKIAVGEACASLIVSGTDPGRPMTVRFLLGDGALEIQIETRAPAVALHPSKGGRDLDEAPLDESRLGIFLMQCLVDEVEARHDSGTGVTRLRLVKRRQGA